MRAKLLAVAALAAGMMQGAWGESITRAGVTYARRGGLGTGDYVATNVAQTAVDVGALPNEKAGLIANENFREAVEAVSPKIEVVAPTNAVSASGKAADAKATGDALAGKSSLLTARARSKDAPWKIVYAEGYDAETVHIDWYDEGEMYEGWGWLVYDHGAYTLPDGENHDPLALHLSCSGIIVTADRDVYYSPKDEPSKVMPSVGAVSETLGGKANRPQLPVTAGNLAALDADGNLADSEIAKENVLYIGEDGYVQGEIRFNGGALFEGDIQTWFISNAGEGGTHDLHGDKWEYRPDEGMTDDREIAVKGDIPNDMLVKGASGAVETRGGESLNHMTLQKGDAKLELGYDSGGSWTWRCTYPDVYGMGAEGEFYAVPWAQAYVSGPGFSFSAPDAGIWPEIYQFPVGQGGGVIALQGWRSLSQSLMDANTSTNADCECISTNLCKLISPHIEAVNVVEQFWDEELSANWTLRCVDGDLKMSVSTNEDMTAFQRANPVLTDEVTHDETRIHATGGELKFYTR